MPPHPDAPAMRRAPGSPTSSAMGKGLGRECPVATLDGQEASEHILGLVIHPPFPVHWARCSRTWLTCPPAAVLRVGQGRRAECWARRGQDETWSLMPPTWPLQQRACAQVGKEAGKQAGSAPRRLCSTLGSPLPGAGREADRIITAAIWAHGLIPLPFAFCIMDRL